MNLLIEISNNYWNNNLEMIKDFAIAFSEMGLRKWQIITMGISFVVFPVTFFISSKNFDAEAVYGWMMEKPNKDK